MAVRQELEIVAKARVEGLSQIDQFNRKIGTFRRTIRGANFILRTFGISLTAILGGAAIRGFIRQQENLARSLGRTRFALSGFGGGLEKGLEFTERFAKSSQLAGIASKNLAREIAAKTLVAFRDETKAARVATAALLGHKLQLFDASAAVTAMANSSEGNTQAFRDFLKVLGIASPEFASLDSLIENFIRRNEEAAGELTEFSKAFSRFVGALRRIGEGLGKFFGTLLTPILNVLADLLTNPIRAIKDSFLGFLDAIKQLMPLVFKVIVDGFKAMAQLTLIIAQRLFGGLFNIFKSGFTAIGQLTKIVMALLGRTIFDGLKAIGILFVLTIRRIFQIWKTGFQNIALLFQGAFIFLGDLTKGFKDFLVGVWNNISDGIANAVGNIRNTVLSIIEPIRTAIDAINSIIDKIKEFVIEKAKATFFGIGRLFGRQLGGFVQEGRPVVVGERGPELFTPTTGGQITPTNRLGGGTQITINIIGNTLLDEDTAVKIGDMIINRVSLTHRFGLTT